MRAAYELMIYEHQRRGRTAAPTLFCVQPIAQYSAVPTSLNITAWNSYRLQMFLHDIIIQRLKVYLLDQLNITTSVSAAFDSILSYIRRRHDSHVKSQRGARVYSAIYTMKLHDSPSAVWNFGDWKWCTQFIMWRPEYKSPGFHYVLFLSRAVLVLSASINIWKSSSDTTMVQQHGTEFACSQSLWCFFLSLFGVSNKQEDDVTEKLHILMLKIWVFVHLSWYDCFSLWKFAQFHRIRIFQRNKILLFFFYAQ